MRILSVAAAVLLLSGCANVPLGDPARSAELKNFAAKSDVAQVYVCRNDRTMGMAIHPDIEMDGKLIGAIARNTFAYQEVTPGEHTLNVKSLEHDSKMTFKVAAGEQKFFQTWISMGILSGWGIVDDFDSVQGKECVAKGDLIGSPKL